MFIWLKNNINTIQCKVMLAPYGASDVTAYAAVMYCGFAAK